MKHVFVINPVAGKSLAEKELLPKINKIQETLDVEIETYITKGFLDAEKFVRSRSQTGEDIRYYACGGDGTLNEVINGAYGYDNVEVGVIPIGTGNDFIKTFTNQSYFSDLERQIKAEPMVVDLMDYNGRLCANVCNIGFDSEVADKIATLKTYPLVGGHMAYGMGILQQFFKKMGEIFRIELEDGEIIEKEMLLIAVGNGSFYGGGFMALPLASRVSEVLDICIVKKISRLQFISLIKDYKKGKHTENPKFKDCVIYRKSKFINIRGVKDFKLCVDGEISIAREVRLKIAPKALKFSVPEGCELIKS